MNSCSFYADKVRSASDGLGLLAIRIWLAYEFVAAGFIKISGGWQPPYWFGTLTFPPPVSWLPNELNWLLAAVLELGLGAALALGLFSRLAAFGLLFITWVAVYSVHFDLGWAGWNQIETETGLGFKVPLMIAVMLSAIMSQGGGRFSMDSVIVRMPLFQRNSNSACSAIQT